MTTPTPDSRYQQSFNGAGRDAQARKSKALTVALDLRKFEIELYWKRATYFWAFTAAAFGAYIAVLSAKDGLDNKPQVLLLVSCIGLVFAVAWYFVNRGSKSWQENWESHVDLLEDEVMGPMYKTVMQDKSPFWKIEGSYPFSVSKINQLLSLFVVVIFALLVADTLVKHYTLSSDWKLFPTACILATVGCIVLFIWRGRTSSGKKSVHVVLRSTHAASYDDQRG